MSQDMNQDQVLGITGYDPLFPNLIIMFETRKDKCWGHWKNNRVAKCDCLARIWACVLNSGVNKCTTCDSSGSSVL